jgi:hypothetical protein
MDGNKEVKVKRRKAQGRTPWPSSFLTFSSTHPRIKQITRGEIGNARLTDNQASGTL